MKRVISLLYLGSDSRGVKDLLVTGRVFSLLSFSSMLFFMTLGLSVMAHQQSDKSPLHSMNGFAATVSSGFFGDMLEMEMPAFQSSLESGSYTGQQISAFLVRSLTNINPSDPTSFLAGELPGMQVNESFLIRKGISTDASVGPQDYVIIYDPLSGLNEHDGTAVVIGEKQSSNIVDEGEEPTVGIVNGDSGGQSDIPTTGNSKVAFIYHSHSRESWFPEIKADSKDPSSATKNITMVGKRLAEKLEEKGVGSMHSDMDYPTVMDGYRWELSYKYSMKTVKEAIASNKELTFFFDIHRDSQKRKYTTIDIDGVSFAQVYFVIGQRNPNWKENEKFATQIHGALEEKYPGLSRGIWGKTAATGNAEYNQSLASESVLIEIGGVDNTLEESYRTADALAEVISDLYWKDEKVSGKE